MILLKILQISAYNYLSEINTNIDLLSPSNISVESKHIMKILYLSNEYFKLTEYVKITQETNASLSLSETIESCPDFAEEINKNPEEENKQGIERPFTLGDFLEKIDGLTS